MSSLQTTGMPNLCILTNSSHSSTFVLKDNALRDSRERSWGTWSILSANNKRQHRLQAPRNKRWCQSCSTEKVIYVRVRGILTGCLSPIQCLWETLLTISTAICLSKQSPLSNKCPQNKTFQRLLNLTCWLFLTSKRWQLMLSTCNLFRGK